MILCKQKCWKHFREHLQFKTILVFLAHASIVYLFLGFRSFSGSIHLRRSNQHSQKPGRQRPQGDDQQKNSCRSKRGQRSHTHEISWHIEIYELIYPRNIKNCWKLADEQHICWCTLHMWRIYPTWGRREGGRKVVGTLCLLIIAPCKEQSII